MAVAYSGGRDSTALLHATVAAMPPGVEVLALHVHHGLSSHADDWLLHCESQCTTWALAGAALRFASTRIDRSPEKGQSVEAWARTMRYRALRDMAASHGAHIVLLAHHRRDQAETFLIQAFRGAGVAGLASMPRAVRRDGILWARPWLDRAHEDIDRYVRDHALAFIVDPSNADPRFSRSLLRTEVWPVLREAFPHHERSLADCARWAQEANACLAELAALDLSTVAAGERGISLAAWLALSRPRRVNVLRTWLHAQCGRAAPASLVRRLLDELQQESVARWVLKGGELRTYRGLLYFEPMDGAFSPAAVEREGEMTVQSPGAFPLPGWGGCLQVVDAVAGGVPLTALGTLALRAPRGSVQFQAGVGRPPRSLKKQYQSAGIPAWQRQGPLLYSNEQLIFVPGLGLDARVIASPGQAQVALSWLADSAAEMAGGAS